MRRHRCGGLCNIVLVLGMAALLPACVTTEAANTPALETTAGNAASAPAETAVAAAPMTRERASTDCWMKYEKEGRHLSLDRRLPLVEKCTAEKLKAGR